MRATRVFTTLMVRAVGFGVAGCGCTYQTNATQPATFDPNGGTGTFTVTTNQASGKWNADEDSQAEDWVKVAGGTVTNRVDEFTVSSQAQQPNVPLPRSGNIQIDEDGSKSTAKATVKVTQNP